MDETSTIDDILRVHGNREEASKPNDIYKLRDETPKPNDGDEPMDEESDRDVEHE